MEAKTGSTPTNQPISTTPPSKEITDPQKIIARLQDLHSGDVITSNESRTQRVVLSVTGENVTLIAMEGLNLETDLKIDPNAIDKMIPQFQTKDQLVEKAGKGYFFKIEPNKFSQEDTTIIRNQFFN